MRRMELNLGLAAIVIASAAACTPRPVADAEHETVALGPPDATAPAIEPISPERLAELKARFPVLREEEAPEPQPNGDARADRVPERVRQNLSPVVLERVTGGATFYANTFEGRRTASGIPFRQNQMVAAHRAYPFGTVLRVTNLSNDRAVQVRVVDRGPFGGDANKRRTIIDLSSRAAGQLGFVDAGRAQVRVEVLEWGEGITRTS
jgi:rare lipoprotein A